MLLLQTFGLKIQNNFRATIYIYLSGCASRFIYIYDPDKIDTFIACAPEVRILNGKLLTHVWKIGKKAFDKVVPSLKDINKKEIFI